VYTRPLLKRRVVLLNLQPNPFCSRYCSPPKNDRCVRVYINGRDAFKVNSHLSRKVRATSSRSFSSVRKELNSLNDYLEIHVIIVFIVGRHLTATPLPLWMGLELAVSNSGGSDCVDNCTDDM